MLYPTPKADFDGVTTGLRLLEKAVDNIALGNDQPEQRAEYLGEAANLLHDAWLSVQTAYGRALSEAAAKREQEGYRLCVRCHQWKPQGETVRLASRQEAKDEASVNHWVECHGCLGLTALQTHHEDDTDPFEQDDLP